MSDNSDHATTRDSVDLRESKRHFRPSGRRAINDGREFRRVQVRIKPDIIERVRARARDEQRPYAQVLGELIELAVETELARSANLVGVPRN